MKSNHNIPYKRQVDGSFSVHKFKSQFVNVIADKELKPIRHF